MNSAKYKIFAMLYTFVRRRQHVRASIPLLDKSKLHNRNIKIKKINIYDSHFY